MKKRNLTVLSLALALGASSCSSQKAEAQAETGAPAREAVAEAAPAPDPVAPIPFEVRKFEKEVGDNELEIEYPVKGNPELVAAVRKWINEQLSDTYRGDMDNAEAFFRHYAAQVGQDPELNEYGGYVKNEFEVEYKNDLVVTYDHTSYEYEGGAHGMGGVYGTTFLQSDGSIFGKHCFKTLNALRPLFVEGLKRYFKVKTDAELADCLSNPDGLKHLAAPGMEPWVEEGGVVFSYTPYEIAPYSSGSPRFTIPFAQVEPYLTEEGLRFFGK